MTNLPWYSLVLAMLLTAQVDPLHGAKGVKGPQFRLPPPPPIQPPKPMQPGQPLLFLSTQLPVWLVLLLFVWRQQQVQAERLKMLADEEENKTSYTEEDAVQDYEFKIVRNELNLFDQPQLLADALREEAQAGWQLVEKFDGNRMRLKRPASQRANDSVLPRDYDPYRTAVLPETTRKIKAAKRIKELKILGGITAGSLAAALVLWTATTAVSSDLSRGWHMALFVSALFASLAAVACGIGLIARYFVRCSGK